MEYPQITRYPQQPFDTLSLDAAALLNHSVAWYRLFYPDSKTMNGPIEFVRTLTLCPGSLQRVPDMRCAQMYDDPARHFSAIDDLIQAGYVEKRFYGPATYGHTTYAMIWERVMDALPAALTEADSMLKCPTCDAGTMTIQVHSLPSNGEPPATVHIPCVDCRGHGTITQARADEIERQKLIWCRCDASSGSHYVPDTPGAKHHWLCDDCGKVTQIG